MLEATESVPPRRRAERKAHPEVRSNGRRDGLSNKERKRLADVLSTLRVLLNELCDFAGDGGDLHALGQVNGDGRVDEPGDPDKLTE